MNFIVVMAIIIIFIICVFNYLIYRRNRNTILKAGKKWDEIVKELSSSFRDDIISKAAKNQGCRKY